MKFIILAGGLGERLWPMSRIMNPKSLLKLHEKKSLLQKTCEFALEITKAKNILTVGNVKTAVDCKIQLNKVDKSLPMILEPMQKNTAAAIAAALEFIKSKRDETIVILPVDFGVKDTEKLKEAISKMLKIASKGYIASIGIKPKYAESGYGYIIAGEDFQGGKRVEKFVEKPDYNKALEFSKNKNCYWNCGIYAAKASVLLEAIKTYAPEVCKNFSKEMFDFDCKIKYEYYENILAKSIDSAVIEKVKNLVMVEIQTEWSDLGSWSAMYEKGIKDKNSNVIEGNILTDNVKNSLIYSQKELVCVSGVNNKIIVETDDALFVADKSHLQEMNKLITEIKKRDKKLLETHKTVIKPWGYYTVLNVGEGWLTKIISVSAGQSLSLQSHNHRSEHWVILEGSAAISLDDKKIKLNKGQSIDIPVKSKHLLSNNEKDVLKILEVQKGEILSEDDIVRYEDKYGRV